MKNIKKICLLLTILLLSGCSGTYELSFSEDKINEHIEWQVDSLIETTVSDGTVLNLEDKRYYATDEMTKDTLYDKKISKVGDKYKIELDYTHSANNFEKAVVFKYFNYHIFMNNVDDYYLKLTGGLLKGIENQITSTIKVKVKTNNRVLLNNADEIKENTYIWNITKENAPTKEIVFQVSKTEEEVVERGGNLVVTVIIFVMLIILLPIVIWSIGQKIFEKLENRTKS